MNAAAAAGTLLARAEARLAEPAARRLRFGLVRCLVPLGVVLLAVWAGREIEQSGGRLWNWYLLPGLATAALSVAFFALRFQRVLAALDIRVAARASLRITLLATFYHFFVPLAAGADLTRFLSLRSLAPSVQPLRLAGGIVLDHVVGLTALLGMSLTLCGVLAPAILPLDARALGVAAGAGLLGAALLAVRRHRPQGVRGLWAGACRRELARAFALSCLMQGCLAAAVWLGSRGWAIDIGYLDVLLVLTTSLMLQAVPLQLAGIGAAELAGTGLYLALGLSPAGALLLVSLLYCYRLAVAIAGGLWALERVKIR